MSQVKATLRVPYGLREGKMCAARDVPTGLRCGCVCVGCGQPLVAKNQGHKVRPHFAHHVDRACPGGFESSIHHRAKELIVDKKILMLPAWDGDEAMPNPPVALDSGGWLHEGRRVEVPPTVITLTDARPEVQRGDYRPDVVGMDRDGELLIEIRVTHAVGDQKARNVQSDGQRMLEIDLSAITFEDAENPELFEHLVLNTPSNRIWISHPPATEAWRRSRAELNELIRARNKSIAAVLAHRQKLKEQGDLERKAWEARKARHRDECRQPHLRALATLKGKTTKAAINEKYRWLLERDQLTAIEAGNWVTAEAAKSYMELVPARGWVYDAHPRLWQTGAYVHFIAGKASGHAFEQAALGRWVRATYGTDESLWSLFRAQWVARREALKRGRYMRLPWAWYFTPDENKRIPNFFEPIDEFVGNMMRCGVLVRDPDRRGWLTVCEPSKGPVAPEATPTFSPLASSGQRQHIAPQMKVRPAERPSELLPLDPLVGKRIAHEDDGIGMVIGRVTQSSPVYNVRFGNDHCRSILLRANQADWHVVELP